VLEVQVSAVKTGKKMHLFTGEWNWAPQGCSVLPNTSRLRIKADFPEASAVVQLQAAELDTEIGCLEPAPKQAVGASTASEVLLHGSAHAGIGSRRVPASPPCCSGRIPPPSVSVCKFWSRELPLAKLECQSVFTV